MNILTMLTEYKARKAKLDKEQEELDKLKEEIESYTMENTSPDSKGKYKYTCGQYVVTITPCVKTWIDKKSLEADLPEVAIKYTKESPYNRTIVK